MENLDAILVLSGFSLAALAFIYSILKEQSRRLKKIESELNFLTKNAGLACAAGDKTGDALDDDVLLYIKHGEINKAIKLYWARHDVSAHEAELIIRKFQSTLL